MRTTGEGITKNCLTFLTPFLISLPNRDIQPEIIFLLLKIYIYMCRKWKIFLQKWSATL